MMNGRSSRTAIYLLLATLAAAMYAGDVDLGPVSLRVYLYLALGAWMLARCIVAGDPIVTDRRAQWLLLSYGALVVWSAIALLLQGAPVPLLIAKTVNYHAVAFSTALLTLFIVRTRTDVAIFLRGFVLIFLASCVVAILQWQRVPQVWELWHTLRPHVVRVVGEPGAVIRADGSKTWIIPGLFGAASAFGYYISALLPVVFRRFMVRRSLPAVVALILGVVALYLVQQRASLLAVVVSCGILLLVQVRQLGIRFKTIGILVSIAAVVAAVAVMALSMGVAGTPPKNRYLWFKDAGRLQVAEIALKFVADHPVVGGAIQYLQFYEEERTMETRYQSITPHNMFLNAAVFYGLPGLLLTVAFTVQLLATMMHTWTAARARGDWTSITLVVALLGYLISAQFHNASFVSGDFLPWVLIALMLTASAPEAAANGTAVPRAIGIAPARA